MRRLRYWVRMFSGEGFVNPVDELQHSSRSRLLGSKLWHPSAWQPPHHLQAWNWVLCFSCCTGPFSGTITATLRPALNVSQGNRLESGGCPSFWPAQGEAAQSDMEEPPFEWRAPVSLGPGEEKVVKLSDQILQRPSLWWPINMGEQVYATNFLNSAVTLKRNPTSSKWVRRSARLILLFLCANLQPECKFNCVQLNRVCLTWVI